MAECPKCYEDMDESGVCRWCAEKERFSDFAKQHGLAMYPDPSGERYLEPVGEGHGCKKSENSGFMNDLWNALVRASGGSDELIIG